LTTEILERLGFKITNNYSIFISADLNIGRNRFFSIRSYGTPNEMLFLCDVDFVKNIEELKDTVIDNVITLWNYDYDGYLSEDNLITLLEWFGVKK
jgi:hypothetical protein